MKALIALNALLLAAAPASSPAQTNAPLQTRAETSHYEETSRYADVTNFFNELQQRSPLMRMETFGHTVEGRAMPLAILANPPVSQPGDARASGKPIVFIMANIHAGEVEGKEAMQSVAQRLLTGDLRPLLDKIVILIAPIYNADGNEKISAQNRTDQYQPIDGVGVRENSQRLDLNRDYVKLEAPETRALVRLMTDWDPIITVDLHTTDGSYHGYQLTYSIPLNPTIDGDLLAYHREKMMPAIEKALLARHKFRSYYYGNFNTSDNIPKPTNAPTRAWYAFSPKPRVGQNYVGFRNRLTILSEAYSHLDFKGRIDVTAALVEEVFNYAATHAKEILQLAKAADERTIESGLRGPPIPIGLQYSFQSLPKPVTILIGEVTNVLNPRSGVNMVAVVPDQMKPEKMVDYALFTATSTVPSGRAYLFAPDDGLKNIVQKLKEHGIAVEELTAPLKVEAQNFAIKAVRRPARAARGQIAGRSDTHLDGEYKTEMMTFPPGTILVRTAQPLGRLAAYLLEPQSEDGLVVWNFLDSSLGDGKTYPIHKLTGDFSASSRLLDQ